MRRKGSRSRYGARVLAAEPRGILLVKEKWLTDPLWKFPGGEESVRDGGDPARTAARELEEETGLDLPVEDFELLQQPENVRRRRYFFGVWTADMSLHHARVGHYGRTGESVKLIPYNKLPNAIELEDHRKLFLLPEAERFIQRHRLAATNGVTER